MAKPVTLEMLEAGRHALARTYEQRNGDIQRSQDEVLTNIFRAMSEPKTYLKRNRSRIEVLRAGIDLASLDQPIPVQDQKPETMVKNG